MKKTAKAAQAAVVTHEFGDSAQDDPFLVLVAEHDLLRQELVRVRAAAAGPRDAGQVPASEVQVLADSVRLHLQREDRVLLPACEYLFGGRDGAAAVLRKDHAVIDQDLATLVDPRVQRTKDSVETELDRLQGDLESHFSREEHVLFPLMAALLPHPESAAIARILGTVTDPHA